jgi:hypothetical protein
MPEEEKEGSSMAESHIISGAALYRYLTTFTDAK